LGIFDNVDGDTRPKRVSLIGAVLLDGMHQFGDQRIDVGAQRFEVSARQGHAVVVRDDSLTLGIDRSLDVDLTDQTASDFDRAHAVLESAIEHTIDDTP